MEKVSHQRAIVLIALYFLNSEILLIFAKIERKSKF